MNSRGYFFVLTGPSGTGKSSILHYMEQILGAQTAPKYTTRPSRHTEEDERDFIFCEPDHFPSEGVLRFPSYGHFFGIQLDAIEKSIQQGKIHVLIVGDYNAVRQLSSIYKDKLVTIFVFCEPKILEERIFKDPSSQRSTRWSLVREELSTIYDQLDCVNFVVNNSGSLEETFSQIHRIVSRFTET